MAPKRKASALVSTTSSPALSSTSHTAVSKPQSAYKRLKGEPASTLVPKGKRKVAEKGKKDESMLHMLCIETRTGQEKELHFKKLVHSEIDWDNSDHIQSINSWRNQLYGRAGLKTKNIVMWHTEEVAFLELFYLLLIAEGAENGLMVPRSRTILREFNDFFAGKILQDSDGDGMTPRGNREHNAFVSKLNRATGHLNKRLDQVLGGRFGKNFTPAITSDMIQKYLALKAVAPDGSDVCKVDDIFTWKAGAGFKGGKPFIGEWQTAFEKMLQTVPDSHFFDKNEAVGNVDKEPLTTPASAINRAEPFLQRGKELPTTPTSAINRAEHSLKRDKEPPNTPAFAINRTGNSLNRAEEVYEYAQKVQIAAILLELSSRAVIEVNAGNGGGLSNSHIPGDETIPSSPY